MAETRVLHFLSPSHTDYLHPQLPLSAAPVFVPSENVYKEKAMQDKNVDFCGILNLLSALKNAGFPKAELEQVAARIAVQTGATIPISF